MRTKPIFTGAIVALVAAGSLSAQETTRLGRPVATAPEGFSAIQGLRVLSDGRLIIADALEQTVAEINLTRGTVEPIGRQGAGPGEYGMPGQLFAGAGDTTYMLDMSNRRLLIITPNGRVSTETIPLRNPDGSMVPIFPRAMDAQGRIYFDLMGLMMPGLEHIAREGRAPILRWDRSSEKIDTVGYVHFPAQNVQPVRQGEMRISFGGVPFTDDGKGTLLQAPDHLWDYESK